MNEEDRDQILTDIQVNSAVTREKVEAMDGDLKQVRQSINDHEDRLQDVESTTARNSYILGGVASTAGAAIATLAGKLTQWF